MSQYFRLRLPEWGVATTILLYGLIMMFAPLSLNRPGLIGFREYATFWTYACLMIGSFRLMALWINGHWKRTPLIRFIGSCMGIGILSAFLVNYIQSSTNESISFGVATMVGLLAMETCNVIYTVRDIAYRQKYGG